MVEGQGIDYSYNGSPTRSQVLATPPSVCRATDSAPWSAILAAVARDAATNAPAAARPPGRLGRGPPRCRRRSVIHPRRVGRLDVREVRLDGRLDLGACVDHRAGAAASAACDASEPADGSSPVQPARVGTTAAAARTASRFIGDPPPRRARYAEGNAGTIRGTALQQSLPARRTFAAYADVHVALQVRADPMDPVPGDAASASWGTEVRIVDGDFRGPAAHGKRGERFLYLTCGSPSGGEWGMFRRAKLMLNRADPGLVAAAAEGTLVTSVSLTDGQVGPRCAWVDPPAVSWSVGS